MSTNVNTQEETMSVLVLDAGNNIIKVKIARRGRCFIKGDKCNIGVVWISDKTNFSGIQYIINN